MARLLAYLACFVLSSQIVLAQKPESCNEHQKCPESAPCCSQYGECGLGAYCLGGCDPKYSFSLESCVPAPICKSMEYKFENLDSVAPRTKYLGDADKSGWVSSGKPLTTNGDLVMTMAPDTVGTLLSSAHYVWYGKVSARLKTSRGAGVITAFIFMSDVKDEIDFEFVGVDLYTAQTNYYFQGITDYTNGKNLSVDSNTFSDYHVYSIDWKPDSVTWSIDGKPLRTLLKKDTFDKGDNKYHYPQSPSRLQLSLWPGGKEGAPEGTIQWAGGLVDWNHEDIKKHGYYYSLVSEISIECYDPPSGAKIDGDISYIYTDAAGTEDTVKITDKPTVLKSFLGSGTDMGKNESKPGETDVPMIPGLNGAGIGANGQIPSGNDSNGPSTDFTGPSDKHGSSGAPSENERVLKGSIFAVLVAVMVLVTM
ncbi:cell wall glucanase [Histoplasma capsulatum var. duboisii H88]|uniref:Cell wall glucanase n=2 Tax=Ajellomyces capsulatus TaxID=5037 RepID=F0UKP2_AJEC8|nr:cell wall glucanase [Histoplasma capsulatum var. duboisii H88]QSS56628.1 cell wall glucanase [Histoplasma capsulatum var. duboisii H88]